jgi:hypothetical protein
MNYATKVAKRRRKKQKQAIAEHGMVVVGGTVNLGGKPTCYFPKVVLRFKEGTCAVVERIEVASGTPVADLPPLLPRVERA